MRPIEDEAITHTSPPFGAKVKPDTHTRGRRETHDNELVTQTPETEANLFSNPTLIIKLISNLVLIGPLHSPIMIHSHSHQTY